MNQFVRSFRILRSLEIINYIYYIRFIDMYVCFVGHVDDKEFELIYKK